jgi:anti-anti-sigma regulatory factor
MDISTAPRHETAAINPLAPDIPDYELLHRIGRGGFGEVYVARNRHHGEFCAVKVVFSDKSAVELEAIRLYKNIVKDNDYLIQIQHFGKSASGDYYYVMPLADDANGPTVLRAPDQYNPLTLANYRAARGPLPIDEVLAIAEYLLLGLKRLHANHLVHCDVKPANVLRVGGEWRLSDIGIMAPGALVNDGRGTRWFKPPEDRRDCKADVYALGKTLLLLATDATPPRTLTESDPMDEFLHGSVSILGSDERNGALRKVILRACDPDLGKRYTANAMHQAVCKLVKTTSIVLEIVGIDYESLDEDQLVRDIVTRLGLCIVSSRKYRGSVLLQLHLTAAQAEYLLSVVKAGDLNDLGIADAWLGKVKKKPVIRNQEAPAKQHMIDFVLHWHDKIPVFILKEFWVLEMERIPGALTKKTAKVVVDCLRICAPVGIVLDLSKVGYFGSEFIGHLVLLQTLAKQYGSQLVLVGCSDTNREVLHTVGRGTPFTLFDSVAEAVAALSRN